MVGQKKEWEIEPAQRVCTLEDYQGPQARWCPGCGDHAVLNAVQRLCRDKQLPPEKTMVVSGIGCSSRLPHYMSTYGFHSLHGRPFPVACGIRSRRPDLHMFVVTGDGDCCAIGTAHWIHAIRYNMNLTVLLLDNNIYGLTKNQTSPTTHMGEKSNTHPKGASLPPLNPISVTLGITNASFVAQTIDWNPPHLYNTIRAAFEHRGTSFVRVLQRCPHFTSHVFAAAQADMSLNLLMTHDKGGIPLDANVQRLFPNKIEHDPSDLDEAQTLASRTDVYPVGLFYRNEQAARYDEITIRGLGKSQADKVASMHQVLDGFVI
jgi:2-oxoglutarate/2-oxoacid ferredoxin oxidoreductase subunit beta